MTARNVRYVIDSDVFITAKNSYYAFDVCPGFWRSIALRHEDGGRVGSIDRVRGELITGRREEDLVAWARDTLPHSFFDSVDDAAVTAKYAEIMEWSISHTQFTDAAKAKFATGADAWLVAFAHVKGAVVVTLEQRAPNSKTEIKLPDVCHQFGVEFTNTFHMLRELRVRLDVR